VLLTTIGNVTTYTDDEVVNGQTYWYKVSAVNAVGEGAMTGTESATPTAENMDDDGGSNTMLYIIIAIMAIAAVAVAAVFFLRKRK
jgi:LPXTG-motif cell wall-anchored protein